ncbi:hypothetical protein ABKN59_010333 [Abortiporus biennis]
MFTISESKPPSTHWNIITKTIKSTSGYTASRLLFIPSQGFRFTSEEFVSCEEMGYGTYYRFSSITLH